jgi:high-affinity iron transporter
VGLDAPSDPSERHCLTCQDERGIPADLSLQLVVYTLHEFFEAGAVPFVDNEFWHIATEPYGPEGVYGQWLTYLMVLVPAAWLGYVWLKDRRVGAPVTH